MHILMTGAAGMIGQKLLGRLVQDGGLEGQAITHVTLQDVAPAAVPAGAPFTSDIMTSDLADAGVSARLVENRPDLIFHLAAIVSADAEAHFEKGYRVNLDGTRHLLDAIRAFGPTYVPRFVFTSGGAVFGTPLPDVIDDAFLSAPLSSYGTQKAICELLLADYTRRGVLDGIGLRFPTICIRPGKANKAASGFFSGIIREPLNGQEAILPVAKTVRHWMTSPRSAINYLVRAATMDLTTLGPRRNLNMPGLSVTVAEQIEALRRLAGDATVNLIHAEPDPTIIRIVDSWPQRFDTKRALEAGFRSEASFDEILQVYLDDELSQKRILQ